MPHLTEPSPSSVMPLHALTVHLHPEDNVAIARVPLQPGTVLLLGGKGQRPTQVQVHHLIPAGHKLAIRQIPAGACVRRYGHIIGAAKQTIGAGEHVHSHNLGLGELTLDYAFGVDARLVRLAPSPERRTFLGYKRADGRVGTRNYIAVISTVNCSAHTCLQIAHHFSPERLAAFPNVDGIVAFTYRGICSMQIGGPTHTILQRTLAGFARHPNIGAYLFVGLGCETNQASDLIREHRLGTNGEASALTLSIQELGGTQPAIDAGISIVEALLPQVNTAERTPQPMAELMLALQCGGSDGWSGVTANPVVGLVADEVVRQGGTVVLAETPEIYGAEHLLTRRAINAQVGQKLVEQVQAWEERTKLLGTEINNNPTYGNKAGGLTTIYEKALGAVAKGGHTPLMDVYHYAEQVSTRGLAFMDTPGYDPVSVTGQVAGGCNLVLFTTGRGSVFGFKPAPTVKVASSTALYESMPGDMDFDAGRLLEGAPIESLAAGLLHLVLEVASGHPSKSEAQGIGEAEFSPWDLGEAL